MIEGDIALAILVFGLAGACLGFLPYNLASPARIFLGDGGSLPIGFVVAASIMALPLGAELGLEHLLVGVLLAGLPVLDTALVSVSRRRAGLSLLQGGRDHLTHRLVRAARQRPHRRADAGSRPGVPRRRRHRRGRARTRLGGRWPGRSGSSSPPRRSRCSRRAHGRLSGPRRPHLARSRALWRDGARAPTQAGRASSRPLVIAFIAISCGLSPFLYGFYEVGVWGPIALGMLAALLGLLDRPAGGAASAPRSSPAGALALLLALGAPLHELGRVRRSGPDRGQPLAALRRPVRRSRAAASRRPAGHDRRRRRRRPRSSSSAAICSLRMLAGTAVELFLPAASTSRSATSTARRAPAGRRVAARRARRAGATTLARRRGRGWRAAPCWRSCCSGRRGRCCPPLPCRCSRCSCSCPGRTRRAWVLVAVACGLAVALGPVLEVYDSAGAARARRTTA